MVATGRCLPHRRRSRWLRCTPIASLAGTSAAIVLDHILATMRDVLDSMPDWLAAVVVLSLAASGLCLPDQARRARASTFLPKSRLVALSTTRLTGNTMRSNIFSDVPLGSPEASPMNL